MVTVELDAGSEDVEYATEVLTVVETLVEDDTVDVRDSGAVGTEDDGGWDAATDAFKLPIIAATLSDPESC